MKLCVGIFEEIKFRVQVLGFISQEHVERIAVFIETTAKESPERLKATIDEVVSIFRGDQSAVHLIDRLRNSEPNKTNGVHVALLESDIVHEWMKTNHDFLAQRILKKSYPAR